jgi:hypothetical protein
MPVDNQLPVDNEQSRVEHAGSAVLPKKSGLITYLLVLFAVPFLLYPLPFYLVRLPSYLSWNRTMDFRPLDFAFTAAGQNADIVIFGDSSAFYGIDARQMSDALGTKVLILPSNQGELMAIDDSPLLHYIRADKPPRLIVFYFAPWGFDYRHVADIAPMYDGVEMLMRHGSAREILPFAAANPLLAFQFPLMFYRANLNANFFAAAKFRNQSALLAATNGHDDVLGLTRFGPECVIPSGFIGRIRFDWVRQMSEKYQTSATSVMYFAAPIPDCANAQAVVDRSSGALPVVPRTMPAELFVEDSFYVHLYAAGVPQSTRNLIDAVRSRLASVEP